MLTGANILEFQTKGYTILINGLSEAELKHLHDEADTLTNYLISEGYDIINDFGCIVEPWSCGFLDGSSDYNMDRDKYSKIRNSISWNNSCDTVQASDIVLSKYGSTWASLLLQQQVYLLNEQFIIKPPFSLLSSPFAWHKDSDYYQDERHRQERTVACWTALDTVDENNGTIEIKDFLGNQETICVPAGSIVFMSDQLLHTSTGNASSKFRRAYMTQFSSSPLLYQDGQCVALAIKCD
ncbi:hypothetical protein INT47_000532 [Mucor saturninus]|uniref:Phytanoyl-CoA dioxygenase n=1 Tax=Mucor saturninus TaxID=64648 RepID=A0A8H7R0H3_9FUNG|nr:hypothetical protein INT47_000532 [Mucor saturninus]